MFVECFKQVKLGVLFDFYAEVVQLFDRCVTCQEVGRTRSEADDFQVLNSYNCSCNRYEIFDHGCYVFCIANRVLRNVCVQVAQFQVVACVQNAAVCIAASAYKVVAGLFCCCYYHARSVEVFYKQGFLGLRSEVSKVYNKCITLCFFQVFECVHHVDFILDDDWTFVDFSVVCFYDCFSSVLGKAVREAVTAYCNDT